MATDQQTRCSCSPGSGAPSSGCCATSRPTGEIRTAPRTVTVSDRLDHLLARLGWNRSGHRVEPGLYRLGTPTAGSDVFASANYTLSFDALRSALAGIDAWILVLDTHGINVWCAAGKGTFGTDELVRRITAADLAAIVSHRRIIVPQLGAPGVSAQEIARQSGFAVEFGPVRAQDLPRYLKDHTATPDMRKVEFPVADRLILAPVELVAALPLFLAAIALWFLAGPMAAGAAVATILAGTVLFPVLLPFIPTRDFSTKGLILGGIVALPFMYAFATDAALPVWARGLSVLTVFLVMTAVVSYLALNFTGSTTFTSRTGVKREIFRYVPLLAVMAGAGLVGGIALGVSRLFGVI